MKKDKLILSSIGLHKLDWKQIKKLADAEKRSVSWIIREKIIVPFLDKISPEQG